MGVYVYDSVNDALLPATGGSSDVWSSVALVDSNNQVTFTGLNDKYAYALYCKDVLANIISATKTGSGSNVSITYTLSGVLIGDECKLRMLGTGSLSLDDGGGGSELHTYSTTEQVVGTWINGKPVYEVSVSGTMPNSTATTDTVIASNVTGLGAGAIEFVVQFDIQIQSTAGAPFANDWMVEADTLTKYAYYWGRSDQLVVGAIPSNLVGLPFTAVLRYTKVAD